VDGWFSNEIRRGIAVIITTIEGTTTINTNEVEVVHRVGVWCPESIRAPPNLQGTFSFIPRAEEVEKSRAYGSSDWSACDNKASKAWPTQTVWNKSS
jgi:hypothetical protein